MAGYLYQRVKGSGIQQAGEFAAAMATLKITVNGPFTGTKEEVEAVQKSNRKVYPTLNS
jgi:sugar/nucleoside kinase (ribokinase family)